MTRATRFCVTLDVERDYGPSWATPRERTFRSVVEALPHRFAPLCARHGVRPTYLVSAEVLLDREAVATMRSLTDCELGAHLHAEYVPPGPRPGTWNDPSLRISTMQCELEPEDERQRLATLTELFAQQIGHRPQSFRAGRFGASAHTGRFLTELGYAVDSSVSPGVLWTDGQGRARPDWRGLPFSPWRVHDDGDLRHAGRSPLHEIPVTVVPASVLGRNGDDPVWLRPWYSDRATMLAILERAARDEDRGAPWRTLCLMFHSMELVAGASPYAQNEAEVERVLADLEAVFARARELGFASATLTEATNALARSDDVRTRREAVAIDVAKWTAPDARWSAFENSFDPAPVLARHGVQPWFLYSIEKRHERWDNCLGYAWLAEHAPKDGPILDVGSGPGVNLQWLARAGRKALLGCDLDPKAVAAGNELAVATGAPIRLFADDGRTFAAAPEQRYAGIAATNWIQLVPDFDLDAFLDRATSLLAPGGALLLDYVDESYSNEPRHRWLTSDWNKPESERRESEYRTRFSPTVLVDTLRRRGFAVDRHWRVDGPIPRGVLGCRFVGATAAPRPVVLFVVDAKGWAHERKAQNLCRVLQDRFDGRTALQDEVTRAQLDEADLVVLFYWRQLQSLERLAPDFERLRSKLLLGICSHNELEGEFRAPGLAALRRLPRAVFTHSELLEREYRPLVGGPAWCLPNGVDTTFFSPGPARTRTKGRLRVGWAGSVANFGADLRGLPNVIQPAAAAVPGVELVIAAREDAWRTAEQMRDFYRSLDVYVCASRVEGTPNPCLEAAACGVPVVTTAVGNMPELIRDGENGRLLPRDANAFARAFAELRDEPGLVARMGERIRADVEREWDWAQRADGFAHMFESVLAAQRGKQAAADALRTAVAAHERGDRAAERAACYAALDADPACGLAHARLAESWWDEGGEAGLRTALGHQRAALAFAKDDIAVREAVARLLRRQGRADAAARLVPA